MSHLHATAESSEHLISAFTSAALEWTVAVRGTVHGLALHIIGVIQQQWTHRRLIRLSDHMLRDLGFERDWDGSIRSLRDPD